MNIILDGILFDLVHRIRNNSVFSFYHYRNFTIKQQKDMLFPSPVSIMDPAQIKEMREQIRFARACVAMKEERYEEALSSFENLPQAKAAYYTGMV